MADKSGMVGFLEKFQEQIVEGYKLGQWIGVSGKFENIVVCGMGGSSLGGRILKSYIGNKIPVFVVDDYKLPDFVNNKSLVFSVSYSGNTEETIETYMQAIKRGFNPVVLASGGKLEELAKQNSSQFIRLPSGLPPRNSYGYQFFSILRVLENSGLVEKNSGLVEELAVFIGKQKEQAKLKAKQIAEKLVNKIPVVYSSKNLEAAAYKWKKNFNESSKVMAFNNVFPEQNHNEINGFVKPNGNFHLIFIKDKDDHPRIRKRFEMVRKIAGENNIETTDIETKGNNLLERVMDAIYLGDWIGYYLALEYGVDPVKTELVWALKKMLD